MKNKIISLLLLFTIGIYTYSNETFKNILLERVMPFYSETIPDMLQDTDGFLWIGTSKSLFKFDGIRLKAIPAHQLSSNQISVTKLLSDSNNKLWVGTKEGLFYYNEQDDVLNSFQTKDTQIDKEHITTITEDNEGFLWIGTLNGIYKISLKNNENIKYYFSDSKNLSLSDNKIKILFFSSNGDLWAGTSAGLNRYNKITDSFDSFFLNLNKKDHTNTIVAITEDMFKGLWIGTLSGCYKLVEDVFYKIEEGGNQVITCLYTDTQNNIWLGTSKTLYLYNIHKSSFKKIVTDDRYFNNVINIVEDKSGCMWFGTYKNGLYKFPFAHLPIHSIINNYSLPLQGNGTLYEELSTPEAISIYIDSSNDLWVATEHGVNRKKKDRNVFFYYTYPSWIKKEIPSKYSKQFYEDKNGRLYLLFDNKKTLNLKLDNARNFQSFNLNESLFITNILSKNNILFIDEENKRIVKLLRKNILSIQEYVEDNGNYKFKAQKEYLLPEVNNDWTNKFITGLDIDEYFNLWVGTDGLGVLFIPVENSRPPQFITSKDGLIDDMIVSLIIDKNNNIWVASTNGINCIRGENREIIFSNSSSSTNNMNSYLKRSVTSDTYGNIYFGKENGIIYFNPDSLINTVRPFKLLISDLIINGKSIKPNEKVNKTVVFTENLNNSKQIKLGPGQKSFTIEFSNTEFNSPSSSLFRYKLSGANEEWIYCSGNNASATYSNLNGGKYIFQLQSSNENHLWEEIEKKINIIVVPFFYETLWFKFLVIIFILTSTSLFVFIRFNNIKKRNKKLQMLVDKRTQELKQSNIELAARKNEVEELTEMKNRFFANVSHEFKTPLSLISAPIELLLKKQLPQECMSHLNVILENSKRLNNLVKQIMNISRLEAGKESLMLSRFNLNTLVNGIYNEFTPLTTRLGIILTSSIPSSEIWVKADYVKIEAILINLLSNSSKYCSPGDKIEIKVTTKDSENADNKVSIIVSDSGPGIPEEICSHVFDRFYMVSRNDKTIKDSTGIGLSLVHEYVKMHNGEIILNAEKGTSFEILLSILDKDNTWSETQLHPDIFISNPLKHITKTDPEKNKDESKILIVEDNIELLNYLTTIIGDIYNVRTAINGKEALDILEEYNPDVIVSDLMMPVMDGKELCRSIKTDINRCDISFILLTAVSDEKSMIQSWNLGADDYITKPFSIDILMARIKNILESSARIRTKYTKGNLKDFENSISSLDKEFIDELRNFIIENIESEELGVQSLSSSMNMSQSTLLRKIKRLTGLSIIEFVKQIKLDFAAELLLSRDKNTTEVCFMSGFSSLSYFSKIFKERFKVAPKDYRKLKMNN